MHYFMVGVGGAVGSIVRYAFSLWFNPNSSDVFPKGTFLANMAGCFFIGLFSFWASTEGRLSEESKLLLLTGFCGGFTTFSTFSSEGLAFLKNGQLGLYVAYTAGSVLLGLGLVWAGFFLGKTMA